MKLFNVFNIEIKISLFIFLILIFSMFFNYFFNLLILIIIVLSHELAHCYMCNYYGIKIDEIELFIFGGVAKFQGDIENNSKAEIFISLAGPLLNFLLVIITIIIINVFNITYNNIVQFFLTTNLTIGLFNLIPMLPLDGGRIIRGIIGYYLGVKKATVIVIKIGYFICILLFSIGIYLTLVYNVEYIFLSALALYITFLNKKEKERSHYVFIKNLVLKKKSLFSQGTMPSKHIIAMEFINIKKIFDEFNLEEYYIITVMNTDGKVIGSISESQIIDAIIKYDSNNTTLADLLQIYSNRK